jgi:3-hydroxyisobutyrate dehydrogenase-like beta-hydroxyacid dehydrogenase
MRIGCVGLGRIGYHLAANLRAPGLPETLEEYLATMPRAQREVDRRTD